MMDVTGYFKSNKPLKEREDTLFSLINKLDKESFKLFSEIIDLDKDSSYKIDSLVKRSKELYELFLSVSECFEYLNKIQLSSYDYAVKRLQTKRLIAGMITVNLFVFNALLAIIPFIMLNMKANKEFADEICNINDRVFKYDENQLNVIKTTLENCKRLLTGKINRLEDILEKDNNGLIIESNNIIEEFINGTIGEEYIEKLPVEIKKNIINILHNDLNVESTNIYELLGLTKKQYNDNIRLVKDMIN